MNELHPGNSERSLTWHNVAKTGLVQVEPSRRIFIKRTAAVAIAAGLFFNSSNTISANPRIEEIPVQRPTDPEKDRIVSYDWKSILGEGRGLIKPYLNEGSLNVESPEDLIARINEKAFFDPRIGVKHVFERYKVPNFDVVMATQIGILNQEYVLKFILGSEKDVHAYTQTAPLTEEVINKIKGFQVYWMQNTINDAEFRGGKNETLPIEIGVRNLKITMPFS